jgi:hypothetical protein
MGLVVVLQVNPNAFMPTAEAQGPQLTSSELPLQSVGFWHLASSAQPTRGLLMTAAMRQQLRLLASMPDRLLSVPAMLGA